ncbi:MAG: DNA-binding protein [Cyanomargarita calcarea GSE-NOS-MK-12-04C]|jgi:hypothetical protein|uniref:DNA-binding protein n=1 Tax=Cyanomargarita calcarea GSE-NOS-MK-12-04C TaxID=2839659 RepID=A0A951UTM0_9CYAN|nr:DNA-binding protein [Cyanomargarita calcarea GSE-NOS-MK-12-04C]
MYVDVPQTALMLRVSQTRVRQYLGEGRVQGAFKVGNNWVIPLFDGEPVITPGTRGPKFSWAARRPTPVNRIHVNQHIIRNNTKTGEREPVITVKRYDSNSYGHEVVINGPCRVVYEPDKGLPSCPGAKVWIETYSKVEVICKEFNNIIKNTRVRRGFG